MQDPQTDINETVGPLRHIKSKNCIKQKVHNLSLFLSFVLWKRQIFYLANLEKAHIFLILRSPPGCDKLNSCIKAKVNVFGPLSSLIFLKDPQIPIFFLEKTGAPLWVHQIKSCKN